MKNEILQKILNISFHALTYKNIQIHLTKTYKRLLNRNCLQIEIFPIELLQDLNQAMYIVQMCKIFVKSDLAQTWQKP